jgi:hypothetical protein
MIHIRREGGKLLKSETGVSRKSKRDRLAELFVGSDKRDS